ncbi:MAG TPA: hypothetical protein VHE59_12070 [Mucilaginibacter sp.]|nr:hypothetical protein [Mucilaginibacter sp.]
MKPFRAVTAFFTLITFLLLCSCQPHKPGLWVNNDIEHDMRDQLHALNKILFAGLQANNDKMLAGIWSKRMIDNPGRLRTVELIGNRMKEAPFDILDEFYIVSEKKGPHSIGMHNKGINSYTINYDADTREMYIVFFVPKTNANRWMASAIYRKFDYGWKLDRLGLSQYMANGKTAPELYEYAKQELAKHYLVNAVNAMAEARSCLTPYVDWHYPDSARIESVYNKLVNIANRKYVFPYTIGQVATKPRVFAIYTETKPEGVFPVVAYKSTIKLQDTIALKKENENIKRVIGKQVPGIDKDKKYIYYYIYNEWPRYDRSVDRYEIRDLLK